MLFGLTDFDAAVASLWPRNPEPRTENREPRSHQNQNHDDDIDESSDDDGTSSSPGTKLN